MRKLAILIALASGVALANDDTKTRLFEVLPVRLDDSFALVQLSQSALSRSDIQLNFDGRHYSATLVDSEMRADGARLTYQVIGAPSASTVTLHNGLTIGHFSLPSGHSYLLMPDRNGAYQLRRVDDSMSACTVLPGPRRDGTRASQPMRTVLNSTNRKRRAIGPRVTVIDVMETYGPDFLTRVHSAALAEAIIQHWIDATNTALFDSGLGDIRLRLVRAQYSGRYPRDYEPGAVFNDDSIRADRVTYGADLAGFVLRRLISGGQSVAGLAFRPLDTYSPNLGFHYVGGALDPSTFIHEIGHNLGADHDETNASVRDRDPHPFARGFILPGQWRTIMSYRDPCACNLRLKMFSTPSRSYEGSAIGTPELADNARAMRIVAPHVAAYLDPVDDPAAAVPCDFAVSASAQRLPAEGGVLFFDVTRTKGDCTWEMAAIDDWLSDGLPLTSQAPTHRVAVNVAQNDSMPRESFVTVNHHVVAVQQDAPRSLLVPNGGFDRDLSSWTVAGSMIEWAPVNHSPVEGSGSAKIRRNSFGSAGLRQCVAVTGGATYALRLHVFVPDTQMPSPEASVSAVVWTYSSADCSGPALHSDGTYTNALVSGTWYGMDLQIAGTANPVVKSCLIMLDASLPDAVSSRPPFVAYIDDVYFGLKP